MSLSTLTVSQVNAYVKSLLDGDKNLNPVYVSGRFPTLPTTTAPATCIFP